MFTAFSCEEDNGVPIKSTEGYIVGFDPCTINHQYRIGYVIVSIDLKDTLVTYNLSDNNYKMPASVVFKRDTLYQIPWLYFQNYRGCPFSPDTLRYKYGVKISYSIANENEKVYNWCTTDMIFLTIYDQVIIKSATKY